MATNALAAQREAVLDFPVTKALSGQAEVHADFPSTKALSQLGEVLADFPSTKALSADVESVPLDFPVSKAFGVAAEATLIIFLPPFTAQADGALDFPRASALGASDEFLVVLGYTVRCEQPSGPVVTCTLASPTGGGYIVEGEF